MATNLRVPAVLTAAARTAIALLLAGPGAAQNDTVPALLNGLEGGSGTSIPFGVNQPVRVQYIYDAEDLPWSGPRLVQRVSLRADNADPGTTAFAEKRFLFVTVLLSTTAVRAENCSPVYADNYGADAMVVIDNAAIVLPAQPAFAAGVRPANIDFVLPTPWFFGLTPVRPDAPPPGNLLVELRIHSQPDGVYRIDNVGSCAIPNVEFGQLGPQCVPAGGAELLLEPARSMVAGAQFTWTVRQAPVNTGMFLFVGVTSGGFLFGVPTLPLPLPLFDQAQPGLQNPALLQAVPTLTQSAPDCWINVPPLFTLFTTADATGTATASIALAADRSFVGASLFAQALAYSQTANPLQIVTSKGQQSTVCGPLGVARIYNFGSVTATSGQRSLGQGAVLELH
ncbi:MAG: hypothetical protein AB7O97_03665 [Planctomycetota bacterium]